MSEISVFMNMGNNDNSNKINFSPLYHCFCCFLYMNDLLLSVSYSVGYELLFTASTESLL